MVYVLVDTNVLISALIRHGKPRRLVSKLLERHTIASSAQILAELADVLSKEKFTEVTSPQLHEFLSILVNECVLITLNDPVKVVGEDPDDDIILSTAVQSNSNYIVSGDKHLLDLREFKGINIVTVKTMFEILSRASDV